MFSRIHSIPSPKDFQMQHKCFICFTSSRICQFHSANYITLRYNTTYRQIRRYFAIQCKKISVIYNNCKAHSFPDPSTLFTNSL